MAEAVQMHLEAMQEAGESLPANLSIATYIAVPEPEPALT